MRTTRVSEERWKEAQEWELRLWQAAQRKVGWRRFAWPIVRPLLRILGHRRAMGDDWNHWWAQHFDAYRFLPSQLGDYVELGCGPYTNTRLILRGRSARSILCSDPLIHHYVKFEGRWLAEAHRRGEVIIDDIPIEEMTTPPESLDVVVMINVLDHVRDAEACLRIATGLVKPGGYFLFGQDISNESDEGDEVDHAYHDVGHPIRLDYADIEPHLADFVPVLRKDLSREEGRDPRLHSATLVFAGRKRAATSAL